MKKILLFGGSFDPIHYGHLEIAKKVSAHLKVDKCVFLPSKNPRFKTLKTDANHRLAMLKMMLKDEDIDISFDEIDSQDEVNYTYETLKRLLAKEDGEYFLLIGADQVNQLDKWYRIDDLIKLCKIVAYKRNGYVLNQELIAKYNVIVYEGELIDISSTEIREFKKLYTKKEILDYIVDNELYYVPKIKAYLDKQRYQHSISVANLCYEIAQCNNLNPYFAYQAGLIHDIAKNIPEHKARELMKKHYPEYLDLEEFTYHQFLAITILKEDFKIDNQELFNAIIYHCTGNKNMSVYAKIVYAADKIDPLRNYDSSALINACKKNIESGFKVVLKENKEYLDAKYNSCNNRLMNCCYKFYLDKEN